MVEEVRTRGIVLAGGRGSRLFPITLGISKQLLPISDKPMIYYPLSILMLAGIRDILIITTPDDLPNYSRLLGDGSCFGVSFTYAAQPKPEGLAQAFIIGQRFIDDRPVCLILGDNVFYGPGLTSRLHNAINRERGATIFGYQVKNPGHFGVAESDPNGNVISLEEKPEKPKSNCAVTGLYFYDNRVVDYARSLKPSARGEYEITDLNGLYLSDGELYLQMLGRGYAWLDSGTSERLMEASAFIATIEKRQGFKIGCLEEIAFKSGWITTEELLKQAERLRATPYGAYIFSLFD